MQAAFRRHEHDDNPPRRAAAITPITPPRLSPIYSIVQWECSWSGPSLTPVFTLHNSCGAHLAGERRWATTSRPGFFAYVCASVHDSLDQQARSLDRWRALDVSPGH
jgi:hypothetical protein